MYMYRKTNMDIYLIFAASFTRFDKAKKNQCFVSQALPHQV